MSRSTQAEDGHCSRSRASSTAVFDVRRGSLPAAPAYRRSPRWTGRTAATRGAPAPSRVRMTHRCASAAVHGQAAAYIAWFSSRGRVTHGRVPAVGLPVPRSAIRSVPGTQACGRSPAWQRHRRARGKPAPRVRPGSRQAEDRAGSSLQGEAAPGRWTGPHHAAR